MPKVNETIVLGWDDMGGESRQGVYVVLRDFDLQERFEAIAAEFPRMKASNWVYNTISRLLVEQYIAKADIVTHVLHITNRYGMADTQGLRVFYEGRKQ